MAVKSTSSRFSRMLSMLVKNLLNVDESINSSWVSLGSYAFRFFCFSFILIFLATERAREILILIFVSCVCLCVCVRHDSKESLIRYGVTNDLNTDFQSRWVAASVRRRNLGSGSRSLVCPPGFHHFSDAPLSPGGLFPPRPRTGLCLCAGASLQL